MLYFIPAADYANYFTFSATALLFLIPLRLLERKVAAPTATKLNHPSNTKH
jgi:hypothetical protein